MTYNIFIALYLFFLILYVAPTIPPQFMATSTPVASGQQEEFHTALEGIGETSSEVFQTAVLGSSTSISPHSIQPTLSTPLVLPSLSLSPAPQPRWTIDQPSLKESYLPGPSVEPKEEPPVPE